MSRSTALVLLTLGFPLLLVGFWLPAPLGGWVLVATNAVLPMALVGLAVSRSHRRGSPGRVLWVVVVLVALAFAGILATTGDPSPVLGGVPAAALFLLFGLWVVPLIFVCSVYTRTFRRFAPTDEELAGLEDLARRLREKGKQL